jgi:uncharacterized protein YkwD
MKNEGVFRGLPLLAVIAAGGFAAMGCSGLGANKKSPAQVTNGQFKPTLPPAANYGPDPKLTCPTGGPNGALDDLVKKEDLKGKKVATDGRLCAIAETLLGWTPPEPNSAVPDTIRAFLSQYFGLPNTISAGAIIVQDMDLTNPGPVDIAQPMVSPIVNFAEGAKNPRYGMVAERYASSSTGRAGTGTTTVKYHVRLVMYDDTVVLDPLPRSLPAGGTATLSGHVEGDYKNLKVQMVDPVGKLTTTPQQGSTLNAPIACGQRSGKVLVQISGESDAGDVRIANLPISCGGQLATEVAMPSTKSGPVDPQSAEKQIAESINSERTGAGLKPMNVNPALSDIARTVSEKQAARQSVTGSDITHMLKEKEIQAPSISENAAVAFTAEDAYTKLSESPTDRANQMSPDVTDLGVGVVKGADIGGKPTIVVTTLYIKQLPPADPKEVKEKLYDAIAKKREGAKLEALKKDETLESVAQKYADAASKVPSGTLPREEESAIMGPLYKGAMSVNQMGGWMPDETNAMQFAEQPSIVGKGHIVGVGVATGTSERFGKNSIFVMVLVGSKLEAKAPARKTTAPRKKKH